MTDPKKTYLVLECDKCGRYLLAPSNNKTRSCPYCGKRVAVGKARVLASSDNAVDARVSLQQLKLKKEDSSSTVLR
ncbi:MAG TPA: DUF1922 domain-containing protein [Candidatus Saccharimonadales bacterium]|nr:DUF1922 domain-containing protein [Candidatus Saccharimonadales bacterium]